VGTTVDSDKVKDGYSLKVLEARQQVHDAFDGPHRVANRRSI